MDFFLILWNDTVFWLQINNYTQKLHFLLEDYLWTKFSD